MIFRPRNGQAALEYLFTYGWAFMVILITIGGLMYFGFFDFDRLRGSDCVFPAGANCNEFYIGPSLSTSGSGSSNPEVRVILRNTYGVELFIYEMNVSSPSFGTEVGCRVNATVIAGGSGNPFPGGGNSINNVPFAQRPLFIWERDATKEFYCQPSDSSWYLPGERYDITFNGVFSQNVDGAYKHELVGWVSGNAQ